MIDESVKISNTKGTVDNVTDDVKAFLDYVDGVISNDEFVKEIDDEIKEVKKIKQERVSYMTFAMKMMEERKEGRKEGKFEDAIEMLKDKMSLALIAKYTKLSVEQIKQLVSEHNIPVKA